MIQVCIQSFVMQPTEKGINKGTTVSFQTCHAHRVGYMINMFTFDLPLVR